MEVLECSLLERLVWKVGFYRFLPSCPDLALTLSTSTVIWIPDVEISRAMGADHGLDPSHQLASMEEFDPAQWGLPAYDE